MKTFLLFVALITISYFQTPLYAQRPSYIDQCKLVQDLLDTASNTFFDFPGITHDSDIVILDVNNILVNCFKDSIEQLRIILINAGPEFEKVKKEGIFSAQTAKRNFFVFTKEYLNGLTGFRIYHPMSSGSCYWGFKKRKDTFLFSKKSFGWF